MWWKNSVETADKWSKCRCANERELPTEHAVGVAGDDAARDDLARKRPEHHQAHLHLDVRAAVRRVDERLPFRVEAVQRDAQPLLGNDLPSRSALS